jgi:nucleotide-binding universal stress UspA family protein
MLDLQHRRQSANRHHASGQNERRLQSYSGGDAGVNYWANCVRQCDWIIMGSYGPSPLAEMAKGSVVDAVLRASKKPVLICR